MAQDLMKTISVLQNTAIGNCRKRIEDAALRAKGIIASNPPDTDAPGPCQKPQCGVTSVMKRKHGL
ncbi:MAG: hypothetical protein ABSG49_01645 [Methanoregula sp.]|uniref:hypothetical protein n=1 Tax=Methanoregula sp. TaxID=2052170 RepID=UPI003C269E29